MISTPVTFILGAGASEPYDYPLGAGLVHQIVNELTTPSATLWQELLRAGFREGDLEDFRDKLKGSDLLSIDLFLASDIDAEYVRIGKAAIAAIISRFEAAGALFDGGHGRHLYRFLWNEMRTDVTAETFEENRVRIVTYNYDRSFEFYFSKVVENSFSLRPEAARALFKKVVPVVHVHGIVGEPGFYGHSQPLKGDVMNEAAKRIRNVFDPVVVAEDKAFREARRLISAATSVCFLGFSYNETNVERLGLESCLDANAQLFGTGYELRAAEVQRAIELLQPYTPERGVDIRPLESVEFLREVRVW